MQESEDWQKDRERLERYIVREQLVSIMNNTKWEKLRKLMISLGEASPRYRVQCLRTDEVYGTYWDGDWFYHLPTYKWIEWLEIDPVARERRGQRVKNKETDQTQLLTDMLKDCSIPFSMEGGYIRVWGYKRPGASIEFV